VNGGQQLIENRQSMGAPSTCNFRGLRGVGETGTTTMLQTVNTVLLLTSRWQAGTEPVPGVR
jgi:hypothetical protein